MGIEFSQHVPEPPPQTLEERAKAEAELIKERKRFFVKQARVMEREIEKLEDDAKEKRKRIMQDAKASAKGLKDKNVRELIKQYVWSKKAIGNLYMVMTHMQSMSLMVQISSAVRTIGSGTKVAAEVMKNMSAMAKADDTMGSINAFGREAKELQM